MRGIIVRSSGEVFVVAMLGETKVAHYNQGPVPNHTLPTIHILADSTKSTAYSVDNGQE